MFGRLGLFGALGVVVMLGGIGLIALENLTVALGVALTIAGLGLVAYGMVRNLMAAFGMR